MAAFVFTDLIGSTAMKKQMPGANAAERDQAFWENILKPHHQRVGQDLERFQGRIQSDMGDGYLVVFNSPDAAIQAVTWAVTLQEGHQSQPIVAPDGAAVQVKIGISHGRAVEEAGMLVGQAVDMAARISDLATGGQIVVSHSVAVLVDEAQMLEIGTYSHGKRQLKGIGARELFEVLYGRNAPRPLRDDPQRHTPGREGMKNVFLSHAGEDSQIALQLAEALERRGYSTWYYERNTLPGISYLLQCGEAIQYAESFLVLISPHSLASRDVTKELERAFGWERLLLPVLVDLSYAEFRNRQPNWHTIPETAVCLELRNGLQSVVERLIEALVREGIRPNLPQSTPSEHDDPQARISKTWASDANQIDIHDLKQVVFRNETIDDFLHSKSKYFLSANKGLGKSLLLTYKRSLLTEAYREAREGGGKSQAAVFFVPEGKPYLDCMSDLRSLKRGHERFLSSVGNAKRLWGLALRVSTLSHHSALLGAEDEKDLARLPPRLLRWLQGAKVEPTVVFKELLSYPIGDINRAIDDTENLLEHKFRGIHSGTFVFLDKVDQGIRNLPQSAWIHTQAGLIEAAWDAMNANAHVKIFATIRQEAFANYESDIKTNLFGATTVIQYSDQELEELLDQLTACYEGGKTFKQFIGLNVVKNPHREFLESSFRYLRRHTLGRPRDLVIIASELSRQRPALNEPRYRHIVNETSAAALVSNVFNEMRAFLSCLDDKQERLRFFSLLPHNVLTRNDAEAVYCRFNNLEPGSFEFFGPDSEELRHPFWELYNTGLLGVVVKDADERSLVQNFRQPHDVVYDSQSALPDVNYYLIHPALDALIRSQRAAGAYHVFQHVLVGHDCPWEEYYGTLCNAERALFAVDDDELRDLAHCVVKQLTVLCNAGRKDDVPVEMENSDEWMELKERLLQDGPEDLYLWLEELISTSRGATRLS